MKRQAYEEQQRSIRIFLMMFAALAAGVFLLIRLDHSIRPTAEAICAEECRRYASQLIGSSIQKTLLEHPYDYADFAELIYDEAGNITAVETLTGNVNRLQTQLLSDVNEVLEESRDHEISVSLGTASGVWIFAGHGPEVPLRFLPVGSAAVQLVSQLESAGINQTCHTILVQVSLHVAGAIPFCKTETDVTYEYLLTETILVGDVPDAYAVFGP
ncbi:MAG: sporulation protein YunB [Ruminococcus sp.]|nr:sporulation protein YunB [Ruminococcus sp.]